MKLFWRSTRMEARGDQVPPVLRSGPLNETRS
jgi:hypothetical protein